MNLLRFAGAIVYHFFAAMHVLRARTRARGNWDGEVSVLFAAGVRWNAPWASAGMVTASAGSGLVVPKESKLINAVG